MMIAIRSTKLLNRAAPRSNLGLTPMTRQAVAAELQRKDGDHFVLRLGKQGQPTLSILGKHGVLHHIRLGGSGGYVTLPMTRFYEAIPALAALRGEPIAMSDFRARLRAQLGGKPRPLAPDRDVLERPAALALTKKWTLTRGAHVFRTPHGHEWLVGSVFARGALSSVRAALHMYGTRGMVKRLSAPLERVRAEVKALTALDRDLAPIEVTQFEDQVNVFMLAMSMSLEDVQIQPGDASNVAKMLLRELSQRLVAFSKQGYVHLNIAPENILLDDTGALHIGGAGCAEATARWTRSVCGTATYRAPEMQCSWPHSNAKADVWSLAEVVRAKCFHLRRTPADVAALLTAMQVANPTRRLSMEQVAQRAAQLQPANSAAADQARATLRAQARYQEEVNEHLVWAPLSSARQHYVEGPQKGTANVRVQDHAAPAWPLPRPSRLAGPGALRLCLDAAWWMFTLGMAAARALCASVGRAIKTAF